MQKSMMQQLSILTRSTISSSQISPTQLSQITTNLSDSQTYQLRRSRIMHLPGTSSTDLHSNLRFVVVFQTVQIQRLSLQIQTLRVKCKDLNSRLANQYNYEVQIRQLTQRCHQYETNTAGLLEERRKMQQLAGNLYAQIQELRRQGQQQGLKQRYILQIQRSKQFQKQLQKWKNRYNSIQISKNKQFQMIRMEFEEKRKSSINREVKQITIKYENQTQNLLSQIRKLRQQKQMKNQQLSKLQQNLNKLMVKQKQFQNIQMNSVYSQLALISQQNIRLNELMRNKNEQIDNFKNNYKQLNNKLQEYKTYEEQNRYLSTQLTSKNNQIHQLKRILIILQADFQKVSKEVNQFHSMKQYKRSADTASLQMQKLKLTNIIQQKINQNQALRNANRVYQNKLLDIGNVNKQQFAAYQQKIVFLTKQQDKLNNQLRNQLIKNQNYKNKINDFQKIEKIHQNIQRQNEELKNKLTQSNKKQEQSNNKIKILQKNIKIIEQLQDKLFKQQDNKKQASFQREKLNEIIRNLNIQCQTQLKKISIYQSQDAKNSSAQTQMKQYLKKTAFMTQQIDRINNELQRKINQLNQMKQTIKSLCNMKANTQNLQQRIVQNLAQTQKLVLQLDNSKRQNDVLANQVINMQFNNKKIINDLLHTQSQKQQLNKQLNERKAQINNLSNQLSVMAGKMNEYRQLQIHNQDLQKKFDNFKLNYQQLQIKLNNQVKKSQSYYTQLESANGQLLKIRQTSYLSSEFVRQILNIKRQNQQKQKVIDYLKKRLDVMQNILKSLKQKYINQIQQGQQLRKKLDTINLKMNGLDQIINWAGRALQQKMKVCHQNIKLQSAKRIMDTMDSQMTQSLKVNSYNVSNYSSAILGYNSPSIKNSSYLNNSSSTKNIPLSNVYTFRQAGQAGQRIVQRLSQVNINAQIIEQTSLPTKNEINQDNNSMTTSIINTLVTKQSTSKLQNNNQPVSQNKRIIFSSPSQPNRISLLPSNNNNKINYLTLNNQGKNQQQNLLSPPVYSKSGSGSGSGSNDSNGIKRITSFTNFQPTNVSNFQPILMERNNVKVIDGGSNYVKNISHEYAKPLKIKTQTSFTINNQ